MDVAAWLRGLGLERYESTFRENEVDAEVLLDLTGSDLTTMGLPVGPRRKLLKAIAALREGALPSHVAEQSSEAPRPTAAASSDAERRQLTVMFCDLVGSTALSARLDPEDLRAVIGAYHRCCAEVIGRAGGFVAKYMGDGVLAYFGYPRADEHDAERAVRAGLALVEAVARLDTAAGEALQVRVGIATGLVVVGDLIGEGEARERGVVGETPNLAARLQALAEPGTVVIAASTRQLTGGLFDYADLGAVEIKGLAAPVTASRVLRESGPRAASKRCARPARRSSAATRSWRCSCGAGNRRRAARAASCWSLARPASASRASQKPWSSGSRASRIPACASSVRRTTGTMRSARRSPSSSGRPGCGARTRPPSGSTSWRRCSPGRPTISARPRRCSRHCCRSRPASAIPRSTSPRRSKRSGHCGRSWRRSKGWRRRNRC
jgi:class 3 adenylate cyclase